MFRTIKKEQQDGWPIIKQFFCEANRNSELSKRVEPAYGRPYGLLPSPTIRYVKNTYVEVRIENDIAQKNGALKYLYNRVNLAVFFKGLKLDRIDLLELTKEEVIKYFNNSQIFLEKNCDIKIINDNIVKIEAKEESFIFYGSISIPVEDSRVNLADLIKYDTITFAPNGAIWIDDKLDSLSLALSGNIANDLRYGTYNLCYNENLNSLSELSSCNTYSTMWDIVREGKVGEKLKDVVNRIFIDKEDAIDKILTCFRLAHNKYSYGWIEDGSEEYTPRNRDISINLAECKILYSGKNEPNIAGEYYRNIYRIVQGRTTYIHPNVLALQPEDKFRVVPNLRYITFCI